MLYFNVFSGADTPPYESTENAIEKIREVLTKMKRLILTKLRKQHNKLQTVYKECINCLGTYTAAIRLNVSKTLRQPTKPMVE